MSYLSLPTVSKNNLFTPSFLIFLGFASFLVFSQDLADNYNFYQFGIALAILLFFVKNFIYTFAAFEDILNVRRKGIFLVVNTVLQSLQIYSCYMALRMLGQTSYPKEAVLFLSLAAAAFGVQVFLNKNLNITKIVIPNIIFLAVYYVILFLQPAELVVQADLLIRFYQLIAVTTIFFEIFGLLIVSRRFLQVYPNKG